MADKMIKTVGAGLVKKYHTRDPFEIADYLGIIVMQRDLSPLKGMYRVIKRNRFIIIDENLSGKMKEIVCAHELGHDALHRALAKGNGLQEFMLYDMKNTAEYEANVVAADILLDPEDIMRYIIEYGYTADQIARAMHTDINLLTLKISTMTEEGYDLRPQDYRGNFLK